MSEIYALHRTHFAQPHGELSHGAPYRRRRRSKLEPCRRTSRTGAPRWPKTPLGEFLAPRRPHREKPSRGSRPVELGIQLR
jgi:hypothetical protein